MSWAFVQKTAVATGNSTSNPLAAASLPSVAAGNVLVAWASAYNPGTIGSTAVTDDKGNTWTRIDEVVAGGDPFGVALFYADNVAAGNTVVTLDSAGGRYQTFEVAEFSRPSGTLTVDTPVKVSNTTSPVLNGGTPSQSENLALVAIAWYSDDNPTTPSGFTLVGKQTNFSGLTQTLAGFYLIQTSASAPSASIGYGGPTPATHGIIVTLSVPGGGGSVAAGRRSLLGVGY